MDSTLQHLFKPVRVGNCVLSNRLVMAPMTRSRANVDGTPAELAVEYYAQRADVGLIITEGTQPSAAGQGYLLTPAIYTPEHVNGWRKVMDAVHAKGGHVFVQLMHAGRMCHPDNTPLHQVGVAPSAIAPETTMFTPTGMQEIPVPHALSVDEIAQTIQDFRHAARCAVEAGADGVEIHGANGYLIQQFFAPNTNIRADQYGGAVENRARFALEVVRAIVEEIGADKTAIRLSPASTLWGIDEGEQCADLYRYLVTELNAIGLAYLHIMDQGKPELLSMIHAIWQGTLILNRPSRSRDTMGSDVATGMATLEAYGQMVLANPDFVTRIQKQLPLNQADHTTFFCGNEKGYTDYPTWGESV